MKHLSKINNVYYKCRAKKVQLIKLYDVTENLMKASLNASCNNALEFICKADESKVSR